MTGESGTFLDLVMANVPGHAALCDAVFNSDHCALHVTLNVRITRRLLPTRSRAFNYKRADWEALRTSLRLCLWGAVHDMSVDDAVDFFYNLVESAVSDHVPTVSLSRKHPPWFDGQVRAALKEKEKSFVAKKNGIRPLRSSWIFTTNVHFSKIWLPKNTGPIL